ncbi:hypothetical protein MNBD_GAMMA04-78 [hydrothermal vent metagenome]|uniref:Uncharacterized protein n=1 Tax=hydrothermal vent metagenome TaxID=652676 RepID=A0A3B0VKX4_9ZZZZ
MFGSFEMVILIGAICGSIMVVGSMILLYRGVISLQAAAASEALSIELIDEIKLSTRYPALALFLIGFIFFISAAWFAQQGDAKKLTLEGVVSSPDELVDIEIHLSAGPWKQDVFGEEGAFSILFHPNIESLNATVIAPGYENSGVTRRVSINKGSVSIGTIKVGRRMVDNIVPRDEIPPRQAGSTLSSGGQF